MRSDFCAFILTHGRPDRVITYKTLLRSGYTGKVFLVIDDEDKTADEYRNRFGNIVLQFCKSKVAATLDDGDNSGSRVSTTYVRAALFDLAKDVGCKYFIQLDDDYTEFKFRFNACGEYFYRTFRKTCDKVFESLVDFLESTTTLTVAMSQGGDFIGGGGPLALKRKAMNSFVCSTDRPWKCLGRMNEDVSAYVVGNRAGDLFFTTTQVQIDQKQTQTNDGGMSQLYLESGTYVKTFYSVLYAPSCVKVATLSDPRSGQTRIHHKINWHNTAPKILREKWRHPLTAEQNSRAQSLKPPEPCCLLESSPALPLPLKSSAEQPSKRKGAASKPQL